LANASFVTMDDALPEVEAVAVEDERITMVGTLAELREQLGGVYREVDLAGATVLPGFIDAHHHVMALGYWRSQIDCSYPSVTSIVQIVEQVRVRAAGTAPGEWIFGRGYDDNKLRERRHLTRADLDAASPANPVLIRNASGHMSVVNSRALDDAGITSSTPVPQGGKVVLGADGEPTGLLQETAQELLGVPFLPPEPDKLRTYLHAGGRAMLAAGVTSGHEAGIFATPEFGVFQQAWADGTLPLRTYMMLRRPFIEAVEQLGLHTGFGDDRLRIGSIKLISDGSLIGRTAAVCHPYADSTSEDDLGLAMFSQEELDDLVWRSHRAGWQMAIHAIGDRAIEMCLDAYEAALTRAPRADHRHRIEHCGIMRPDLIARTARLGVLPVGQPPFIAEFGDGFLDHLGPERCQLTYPQRSLLEAGIPTMGSSDSPVSSYEPLIGVQAAVTQRTAAGEPFAPSEALTVEEALASYTKNAAFAAFDEHRKGTISPGKLADFAVLGRDPRREPADSISQIPVLATIQGGRFVFEAAIH
jgi:predicted amidohydrolase YtcJ